MADYIAEGKDVRTNETIEKHGDWVEGFLPKYGTITRENAEDIIRKEAGLVFEQVLEDAGVYKCNEAGRIAFKRFLNSVGFHQV